MTTVDYGPATVDYTVGQGSCLPLKVGLQDQAGARIDLAGYGATLVVTWRGGSLTLSTANSRLAIGTDDEGEDVIEGELAAAEIGALPHGRLTTYRWHVTAPGGCPFLFLTGHIKTF